MLQKLSKVLSFIVLILSMGFSNAQKIVFPAAYHYKSERIIKEGINLYDRNQLDSAIMMYNRVDKRDPNYLSAVYEKLLTYEAQEKTKESLDLIESVMKENKLSDFPGLYILYANTLDNDKQYDKADAIYKEAATHMPYNSNLYFNHAISKLKAEKKQEAVDLFLKAIEYGPNSTSAYYFLGATALEDGQLALGSMYLLAYMILNPEGRYSNNIIKMLNSQIGEKYDVKPQLKIAKQGDNFAELDEILKNQLPLNKKYKLRSDIDDIMPRHIQAICDYSKNHEIKNGFAEQKIVPILALISKGNQVENFTYYALSSLTQGEIGATLKKKKPKMELFLKYLNDNHFWNSFASRKDVYGMQGNVVIYYDEGVPNLIGPVVNNKKEGNFIEVNKEGNIITRSIYKNDLLEGETKFFSNKGKLTESMMFSKGVKEGKNITYYENGLISYEGNYKNNELSGPYKTYYYNGGLQTEATFLNGKLVNSIKSYHPNGNISRSQNYKDGKLNGKSEFFNTRGKLISKATYVDNELDGEVIDYFDSTIVRAKSVYLKSELISYEEYHPNGKKAAETIRNNDKSITKNYYNPLGQKTYEERYDSDQILKKSITFDNDGQIEFEEEYDKNMNLKSCKQYSNKSDKPVEIKTKNGKFTFYNRNGIKTCEGAIVKSKKDKEWIYYYPNGRIKSKINYKNGKEDGLSVFYDKKGNIESFYNNIDGKIAGKSYTYKNGEIKSLYHYNEGEMNGPFELYENGKVVEYGQTSENSYTEIVELYNNQPLSITKYNDNFVTMISCYDTNGKLISENYFAEKNGPFTYNTTATTFNHNLKNGVDNGPIIIKDKNGTLIKEANYIGGKANGKEVYYNANGTKSYEGYMVNGTNHGVSTYYDLNGSMRVKTTFNFGDDSGLTTRYYKNGKIQAEYSEINNNFHGENKYYNQDGDLVAKIFFNDNFITGYTHLVNGKMSDKIKVDTNAVKIVSTFDNGSKACSISIDKMLLNGPFQIFGKNEKLNFSADYSFGELHGIRVENYQNGQPYKKEVYQNGQNDGKTEYFNEDGSYILIANYVKDLLTGDYIIYKNGKQDTIKKYYRNNLIEIIKP